MKKNFRKIWVLSSTKFECKDPYSNWFAELTVDENGAPVVASYGSTNGHCKRNSKDKYFDETVQQVMTFLLQNDVEEFKKMRNSLNPKYRQIAEDIRKETASAAASKYDF